MAFFYREGHLHIGTEGGKSQAVRELLPKAWTKPIYLYDLDDIELRYQALSKSLAPIRHSIHYAMKANSHERILKHLAQLGAGVDTVSGGEVRRALAAGLKPGQIIFSGVGKTRQEIELAVSAGIKQINVESPQELERIAEISRSLGRCADIAFRFNPDVNPNTHPYITTGFRENKFGMDQTFLPELVAILHRHPNELRLRGLTLHIGSLLFDLEVMREAIIKTLSVHRNLLSQGFALDRLDIGGGLGIHYETADTGRELKLIRDYGAMVCHLITNLKQELSPSDATRLEVLTEPGRILVGRSGVLISEVQYIKRSMNPATPDKLFAIVDTGMHHLLRPALYQAKHRVLALRENQGPRRTFNVVGPICESSDVLGKDLQLPELNQGDLIAIADTGAYGFAMASEYNSHDLPQELFVSLK